MTLLDLFGYPQWHSYVDPILMIIMAITASLLPLQVLRKNLKELCLMAPEKRICRRVEHILANIARSQSFDDYSCHLSKSGRQYDLEINILVTNSHDWPLTRQDNIREMIHHRLVKPLGQTWLSVSFTGDAKWL